MLRPHALFLALPLLISGVLAGSAAAAPPEDTGFRPPVTPQRPSFSTNTSTTAPGYLEAEVGASLQENLSEIPSLLKLGLLETTELSLGIMPLRSVDLGPTSESGFGDVRLGLRHRFVDEVEGVPSLAAEGWVKLPTADEDKGLGTGETDVGMLFIMSKSMAAFSFDANLGLSFIGDPVENDTNTHVNLIGTASRGLTPALSGYLELFLEIPPDDAKNVWIFDLGVGYSVHPGLVLDAAFAAGLSDTAPDWQVLFGFTTYVFRVF
jgi:hypothetical protein